MEVHFSHRKTGTENRLRKKSEGELHRDEALQGGGWGEKEDQHVTIWSSKFPPTPPHRAHTYFPSSMSFPPFPLRVLAVRASQFLRNTISLDQGFGVVQAMPEGETTWKPYDHNTEFHKRKPGHNKK